MEVTHKVALVVFHLLALAYVRLTDKTGSDRILSLSLLYLFVHNPSEKVELFDNVK